jgi:plasmid stability protein
MPTLSIKNVPSALVARLRERADRQHRSMQGELMAIIQDALASTRAQTGTEVPGTRSGTRRIEEISAEHQAKHRQPFDSGPRAVDILRAERDAR